MPAPLSSLNCRLWRPCGTPALCPVREIQEKLSQKKRVPPTHHPDHHRPAEGKRRWRGSEDRPRHIYEATVSRASAQRRLVDDLLRCSAGAASR